MPEKRILISHKDGREYSVTPAVFKKRYEAQGFTAGEPETPAAFVANVPKVPRRVGARRKATKPAAKARVAQPAPEPVADPTEA